MFHRIKTFIVMPEKRLLMEAWLTQLYVGFILKLVPFKKIPSLFPNPMVGTHPSPVPGEGPGMGAADSGWGLSSLVPGEGPVPIAIGMGAADSGGSPPSPVPTDEGSHAVVNLPSGPHDRMTARPHDRMTAGPQDQFLTCLRTAILLTSPYSFWRNKCLVQSLAARRMLKRRGISSQLSLGLRRDNNNKTYAHAWLKVGDIEIVDKRDDYLEMYAF